MTTRSCSPVSTRSRMALAAGPRRTTVETGTSSGTSASARSTISCASRSRSSSVGTGTKQGQDTRRGETATPTSVSRAPSARATSIACSSALVAASDPSTATRMLWNIAAFSLRLSLGCSLCCLRPAVLRHRNAALLGGATAKGQGDRGDERADRDDADAPQEAADVVRPADEVVEREPGRARGRNRGGGGEDEQVELIAAGAVEEAVAPMHGPDRIQHHNGDREFRQRRQQPCRDQQTAAELGDAGGEIHQQWRAEAKLGETA